MTCLNNRRFANSQHAYGFPRITGVVLDGKTDYDYGNDGDSQAIGACTVRAYSVPDLPLAKSVFLRQTSVVQMSPQN